VDLGWTHCKEWQQHYQASTPVDGRKWRHDPKNTWKRYLDRHVWLPGYKWSWKSCDVVVVVLAVVVLLAVCRWIVRFSLFSVLVCNAEWLFWSDSVWTLVNRSLQCREFLQTVRCCLQLVWHVIIFDAILNKFLMIRLTVAFGRCYKISKEVYCNNVAGWFLLIKCRNGNSFFNFFLKVCVIWIV